MVLREWEAEKGGGIEMTANGLGVSFGVLKCLATR